MLLVAEVHHHHPRHLVHNLVHGRRLGLIDHPGSEFGDGDRAFGAQCRLSVAGNDYRLQVFRSGIQPDLNIFAIFDLHFFGRKSYAGNTEYHL
ncbi:hypothetical protein D3C87_1495190 [compost metagenome]